MHLIFARLDSDDDVVLIEGTTEHQAVSHHRRSQMKYFGWLAWRRYVAMCREQYAAADRFLAQMQFRAVKLAAERATWLRLQARKAILQRVYESGTLR